jgi:predicted nucleic acid-binding protein
LALSRDQHHLAAPRQHAEFVNRRRTYVTTDYVISELVSRLYRRLEASKAEAFVGAMLRAAEAGKHRIERVIPSRFNEAWQLRRKFTDKPDISFVDFTSFVVMRELGIQDVFTGDVHFT